MLDIDASHGEGGGQLVRTAVALAAITGTPIRLDNVRVKRDKPGLAPQHLAAVRAVASLCDARCDGVALRARSFSFTPRRLCAGEFHFDVGTAGSITLVLQALLPVLLHAPAPCKVVVTGGTDVRAAPPLDYFRHVLLALLRGIGARVECSVLRRGYYPRGGGAVEVAVQPERLQSLAMTRPGRVLGIDGLAHVARLPPSIAERMRDSALAALRKIDAPVACETVIVSAEQAVGSGGAIACWARAAHTVLGAGRVAQRGVRAEALGHETGSELASDIAAGAGLDVHAADQMLVYLAMSGGSFSTRAISSHALTAMWLIERFMPVRFEVADTDGAATVRVTAR